MPNSQRVKRINCKLADLANGDFASASKIHLTGRDDEMESVACALKMAAEELEAGKFRCVELARIMDWMALPMLVVSATGRIKVAGKSLAELLCYDLADLKKANIIQLLGHDPLAVRKQWRMTCEQCNPAISLYATMEDKTGRARNCKFQIRKMPRNGLMDEYLVLVSELTLESVQERAAECARSVSDPDDRARCHRVASYLLGTPIDPAPLRVLGITPREQEVLGLLTQGMNSAAIGQALGTQKCTVESQRASILRKFKVKNVAALIRRACELGLLGPF